MGPRIHPAVKSCPQRVRSLDCDWHAFTFVNGKVGLLNSEAVLPFLQQDTGHSYACVKDEEIEAQKKIQVVLSRELL